MAYAVATSPSILRAIGMTCCELLAALASFTILKFIQMHSVVRSLVVREYEQALSEDVALGFEEVQKASVEVV